MVVHGFTDGKSRLVPAIRVSNNNRSATVLDVLHEGTDVFGWPRRIRGDHGTENVLVAQMMEERHGVGAYIWGR